MRHKYATQGFVLSRTPLAEAGMLVTVLSPELGLLRARAEGLRRSGAKLAHALQAFCEADLMLVRGKEGWRITGAVLADEYFSELTFAERARAARVAGLLLRLVHGDSEDSALHGIFTEFVRALSGLSAEEGEAAESLVALRLLRAFGVDAGDVPTTGYDASALAYAQEHRKDLIARINKGISASGL